MVDYLETCGSDAALREWYAVAVMASRELREWGSESQPATESYC
jgi:hypothetical protein